LGSRRQGYELNIFENGRKGGNVGRARCLLPLLLGNVLQPICGPIVFIRDLSIFLFSVGFSKKRSYLELVWDPGKRVMSLVYLKMGEEAIISEQCIARSLYYLGNVLQPMCGPIVFIRNLSIFSFSVGISKN